MHFARSKDLAKTRLSKTSQISALPEKYKEMVVRMR